MEDKKIIKEILELERYLIEEFSDIEITPAKILDLTVKIYRAEQEHSFQLNLNNHLTNITNKLDEISSKLRQK